jgi:hypothetical protein
MGKRWAQLRIDSNVPIEPAHIHLERYECTTSTNAPRISTLPLSATYNPLSFQFTTHSTLTGTDYRVFNSTVDLTRIARDAMQKFDRPM